MFTKTIVFFTILIIINYEIIETTGSNILVFIGQPIRSHFILGNAYVKALLRRGHNVTYVNSFGMNQSMKNLNELVITEMENVIRDVHKFQSEKHDRSLVEQYNHIITHTLKNAEIMVTSNKTRELISSKQQFDVVVVGAAVNEALAGLAHHFDCPLIVLQTMTLNFLNRYFSSNPQQTSIVPEFLIPYTTRMNTWERFINFAFGTYVDVTYYWIHLFKQDAILHKLLPNAPSLYQIIKERTALTLVNSHSSINTAYPIQPSFIEIGGFHIDEPKELPTELKSILDNATEGFILFSMGSNLKSAKLSPTVRQTLLQVFSNLSYPILWKFETDDFPDKPENILIHKWLPQNDVLAHPNIKLFITHGGLLSTTEAVYHGVPVVGVPVFGDQIMNMMIAQQNGFGRMILFKDLTYDSLMSAILKILNNNKYRDTMKKHSKLLQDQPIKPIDSAMFWTEYVIRNKYCEHLQIGSVYLNWFQNKTIPLEIITFCILFSIIFYYLFKMYVSQCILKIILLFNNYKKKID